MRRLKKLLFGLKKRTSNKSQADNKDEKEKPSPGSEQPTGKGTSKESASTGTCEGETAIKPAKKPGHGRRPASDYTGAKIVRLDPPDLSTGDACPEPGCEGHLHQLREPKVTVYLTGQPVINATKYERLVLRCSDCFTRYVAELPEEVKKDDKDGKPEKYDETADLAIALYKYGGGIPFYRQEKLQESCGVPLPASVQFERCERVANACHPVYKHLIELAANAKIHYIDDTRVRILSCYQQDKHRSEKERRATHTSGIVAQDEEGHKIALYFSGRHHAGENLEQLLKLRQAGLDRPIQMADALAVNWDHEEEVIEAKCMVHGRRGILEVEELEPVACKVVLDAISEVYRYEAETKGMSQEERLRYHQSKSGPVMEKMKEWIELQFNERLVEPNSSVGRALQYWLNHWEGLTAWLRVAGAPLDNNAVERALKQFILMRKNSLFFKTEHGAAVGDILGSLIQTCRLNGINPWEYLVTIMRRRKEVRRKPQMFLPWNYQQAESAEASAA